VCRAVGSADQRVRQPRTGAPRAHAARLLLTARSRWSESPYSRAAPPRHLADAAAEGYDCFVTGEADEPTKHAAKESGVHFVAGGHYATETLGVRALGAKLAEQFGLEWEFVDLPNPV
jgi:hypothetical protein